MLTEVLQLGLGLAQRLLDATQLIVDKLNSVLRDEILLLQSTGNIFIHQHVDEIHNLFLVGAIHHDRSHGSLFTDGANREGAHLLDQGWIAIDPERHLAAFERSGIHAFVQGDADTVVSIVDPFTLLILTDGVNLCVRIAL